MSETPPGTDSQAARNLPPVLPPSGRHIFQLFVVPGAIVLGVVVILLGCTGLSGWFFGFRTPQACLEDMKSNNPDVRWRAASDLAQVLKSDRDPQYRSDPKLGLDLADLLKTALDDLDREERAFASSRQQDTPVPQNLKAQRKYVQFLSACLGNMSIPVGVPLLTRMATKDEGDPKSVALLRRHAVWALANMGENRKKFDQLPAAERDRVRAVLSQEAAAAGHPSRAENARTALDALDHKDVGVIDALRECANLTRELTPQGQPNDPNLRAMTAFALGFWTDTQSRQKEAEQILLKLSDPLVENGNGEAVVLDRDD
jgi:hypothetical protein